MKNLHSRSRHNASYNFEAYCAINPALEDLTITKDDGQISIDFSHPISVRELNKAILMHHYDLSYWEIPESTLCPAIPGRAEYIHHLADLLSKDIGGRKIPRGPQITIMDIGTGASLVYPLIGHKQYGWSFIASEVNPDSFKSAIAISSKNKIPEDSITIYLQRDKEKIFDGTISKDDVIDAVVCNPPFHRSKDEAAEHTKRKWRNLGHTKGKRFLNFGGQSSELWYPGGERVFVRKMISESQMFKKNILWFSSLISKKENIPYLVKQMEKHGVTEMKEIEMLLGNKKTRFVAWTYFNEKDRKAWGEYRFNVPKKV